MKSKWTLTQSAFDRLLAWLDEDRERAGEKYEQIREKLIKIFEYRGCYVAEELADETINRVTKKLPEIQATFVGDRRLYFYGVAYNVFHEYVKKKPDEPPLPVPISPREIERSYECLEQCMEQLSAGSREFILQYYAEEKRAKIKNRQQLARKLGLTSNALRLRAHRIKSSLRRCVFKCLRQNKRKKTRNDL